MGGIGGFLSDMFGTSSSANNFKATTPQQNPNSFEYGGAAGGAQAAAQKYSQMGADAENRQGPQINYGQANDDRSLGMGARGSQASALGLMQSAANGNQPSVAAIQQRQGVDAAMQSQQAIAAGARGPAALAGAQYQAANNAAGIQQGAVNSAAMLRAGEMENARNSYMQGATGIRSGDLGQQNQDAQQSQAQSAMDMQQRGLNDSYSLGMTGYETGVNQAQLNAQQNKEHMGMESSLGAQGLDLKRAQGDAGAAESALGHGEGMASAALGAVASDVRVKGAISPETGAGDPMQGVGPYIIHVAGVDPVNTSKLPDSRSAGGSAGGFASDARLKEQRKEERGYEKRAHEAYTYEAEAMPGGPAAVRGPLWQAGIHVAPPPAAVAAAGPPIPQAQPVPLMQGPGLGQQMAQRAAQGDPTRGTSSFDAGQQFGNSLFKAGSRIFGGAAGSAPAPEMGIAAGQGVAPSDARVKREVHNEAYYKGLEDAGRSMQAQLAAQFGGASPINAESTVDAFRRAQGGGAMTQREADQFRRVAPEQLRQAAPAQMLDQISPQSWNYVPGIGEDTTRRRYGVMAQDLERTPMGASIVEQAPDGTKLIDAGKGVGVALGGLSNVHDRLKALEDENAQGLARASGAGAMSAEEARRLREQARAMSASQAGQFAPSGLGGKR